MSPPDTLGNVNTIKFIPQPDIAQRLKKLCQVTNLEASEAINILLDSPLEQIVEGRDSSLLQSCIRPFVYDTKEQELETIAAYERFISEADDGCYDHDAKPARTRGGHWQILFKSTIPDEQPAIYQ